MLKELDEDLKHIKIIQSEMRCTVQNTGYHEAPGTHWLLQQHKKDPGRNEGYIKLNFKKIYRGPTVEWMKLRIKSMIWNIRKKKHLIRKARRKRIKKKPKNLTREGWGKKVYNCN